MYMVHTSVCFPPLNSKQVENIISFLYFVYFCTLRQITKIRAQAHFFSHCLILRFIFLEACHRGSEDVYCLIIEDSTGRAKIFSGCFFFSG